MRRAWIVLFSATVLVVAMVRESAVARDGGLSPLQQLGKDLFFDPALSEPEGQSCASCHAPEVGFTSPNALRNAKEAVVEGALAGRAGNRTPPTVAYAAYSPMLRWDRAEKTYTGGQFRDGRAATLTDQAKGPLLNPVEMNNADGAMVCRKVLKAAYVGLFVEALAEPLDCSTDGFERIVQALAVYESSPEVNPFSSKYDAALAGAVTLTAQEMRGLQLYRGAGKCDQCHPSRPGLRGEPPLFTDFGYDNIGVPRNPANPFYTQSATINPQGAAYVDPGLGGFLNRPSEIGKFKTPTLRNVAAGGDHFVRAYMHNGALKGLQEVMDFYNRRDVDRHMWPPEEARNLNAADLGDLRLSDQDEADIIAFLKTLTDGWRPQGEARN